jgi:hypothetical protein
MTCRRYDHPWIEPEPDWQARALAAEARIKELEGERDAARAGWRGAQVDRSVVNQAREHMERATARAEIAESQLSALQDSVRLKDEALRPFATMARLLDSGWFRGDKADGAPFRSGCAWRDRETGQSRTLTIGDFRRARQALGGGDG